MATINPHKWQKRLCKVRSACTGFALNCLLRLGGYLYRCHIFGCLLESLVALQVDLLPLPSGTPELVPVVCNGLRGEFIVRTQRVVHCREEMTAHEFEQVGRMPDDTCNPA